MFKNYFKTAWRNLLKDKQFTILNVLGLSAGLASALLIFLWVNDELSYDKFNVNAKQIYRITSNISNSKTAVIPVPMGTGIKGTIPRVVNVTRLKATPGIVTVNNQKFEEKNGLYADTNFLHMFSYPLISGDASVVLSSPDKIVLTASLAKKYFGTDDAVGKTLAFDNDIKTNTLTVAGILKDIPSNSHLQFDFILPISLYEKNIDYDGSWGNFDLYTYVQMNKSFQPLQSNLNKVSKLLFNLYAQHENDKGEFTMQPLTDIHLHSGQLILDVPGQGNIAFVRIFSLIAIFIILIACINFMNLSTALSAKRAKEVGLRKTIGALRSQLIGQFLVESFLVAFISLLVGIMLVFLLLPFFNEFTVRNISFSLLNLKTIASLLGIIFVVGIVSGAYPALYLSSFKPIKVLKGVKAFTGQKSFLRNGLVVTQFGISLVLIIGTLVVYKQLQFIQNRDIGFNKKNLMYMKMPQVGDLHNNYEALKATLNDYPNLTEYSIIKYLPANLTTGTTDVLWAGKDPHLQIVFPHLGVDENFLKTFQMHLVAGRFFAQDFMGDENNYVVNEAALKTMQMNAASAIGKPLSVNGRKGEIVGVIKDFNFKPVQQAVEPLILEHSGSGGYLVIRTAPADMQKIVTQVKNVFGSVYKDYPFSYSFVDEAISKLYLSEQQMSKLFSLFAALSVIISCLGLFGLAAYTAERRTKEIGIRKVLGASVAGLVELQAKEFLLLVTVSCVIAFPAAWFIMHHWLQNYAYRININWQIFFAAGLLAIVIALITISFQSIKAALANPVKSLRSE
jgi:predicted permease